MKQDWLRNAIGLAGTKIEDADAFFSGNRKIFRGVQLAFDPPEDDLRMADAGYTSAKMQMLKRLYLHEESLRIAVELWNLRRGQKKYGSVSLTCFAHFKKTETKTSKRASLMGPCLQSVVLTWRKPKGKQPQTHVDVFYRTTEFLKKFPADLVFLRDIILDEFDFSGCPISEIRFHFANVTIHPMYYVTILPHRKDPVETIDRLRMRDEFFWRWVVKWTARYLGGEKYERGIDKFSQALRVKMDAEERISDQHKARLKRYLIDNHPGLRGG